MAISSSSFLVGLRSFGGALINATTTSDTLLHVFVSVVSGVLGVPEGSMRIFMPNDEVLPSHNELKDSKATVGETDINEETVLRVQVAGLRDDEEKFKEAGLQIPTTLPLASQFLLWAAREGRDDVAMAVLNGSPFVDGEVSDAIHARTGNCDIWEDGCLTPLMLAVHHDDAASADLINRLLAEMSSGEISLQSERGRTAMHCAVSFEQRATVKTLSLVMTNDDLAVQDRSGNTALHDAVANENVDNVRDLLHVMPRETVSLINKRGRTALHEVSPLNCSVIAQEFLNVMTAEQIVTQDSRGATALHEAVRFNSVGVINVLLSVMTSSDVAIQDECGKTALHDAANIGDIETVRMLLSHVSADDERFALAAITDRHGRTALHYAADHGHFEAAQELAASMTRETIAHRDRNGRTAFDHAHDNGISALFAFLK